MRSRLGRVDYFNSPVRAQAAETLTATPTQTPETESQGSGHSTSDCLMCHGYADFTGVAKDVSTVSLTFDGHEYNNSVHGKLRLDAWLVTAETLITRIVMTVSSR